ncbi:MAG: sugar ABC transporter permease [candidate division Zixibacteria bacterium]|jgi:multiple sugar transport system permease protein|nr:sugar ABC transporter permease [candidate division Zixibacteria bacterium]
MRSRSLTAALFASPWTVSFAVFWAFPLLYSLWMGFTDYQLLSPHPPRFIGLDNYRALFSDADFISSLKNTFIFVLGTIPVSTIVSLCLALLVNREFKGRGFFRSAYFMPWVTSMVVVALIFTNLFERGGYIAMLARMAGLEPPVNGFLYDRSTALYSIMAMDVWMAAGYYMLIFLAGLKAIPDELYEAAEIAGASAWRQFVSITLPMLRPVALFIVVINSIKSFQVFVEIFVMTKGRFDTSTVVYFVYETGLQTQFKFGYASAAAYVLFLIIGVFSILQFVLMRRKEPVW